MGSCPDTDIDPSTDTENLFENQYLLQLVIISFILMTLMFDSAVILILKDSSLS